MVGKPRTAVRIYYHGPSELVRISICGGQGEEKEAAEEERMGETQALWLPWADMAGWCEEDMES